MIEIFCGIILAALLIVGGVLLFPMLKGEYLVGRDIPDESISQFYYTKAASSYPPSCLRYHFHTENGKKLFYCEKREGNHWPLTENDITESGSMELTEEQWTELLTLLHGGTVTKRKESTESGSRGPWMYLYWKNDRSRYQVFSFASLHETASFETFCASLADQIK